MENYRHKEYRAKIFKKLKAEPDVAKRHAILAEEKAKPEFEKAEKLHKKEKLQNESGKDKEIHGNKMKEEFIAIFVDSYIKEVLEPGYYSLDNGFMETFSLLRERLKGSTLIDLGCGNEMSVGRAYEFATAFDVRNYIGVEKYPEDEKEEYINLIDSLKKGGESGLWKEFALLAEQKHKFPSSTIVFKDMLRFLESRTEQSNFMINGIDYNILDLDYRKSNREAFHKLQQEIVRLVPKGGLVFGSGTANLDKFPELGFRKIGKQTRSWHDNEQIWEKI